MLKINIFLLLNIIFFRYWKVSFQIIASNLAGACVFEAGGGEGGEGVYEKFFIQKRLLILKC